MKHFEGDEINGILKVSENIHEDSLDINPRFWDKAIETTTIVFVGIVLCVMVGIPVGIAMARSPRVRNAILPILDLMQVIPSFCYLIPGIILFGLGAVPAIIGIFIYSCPPLIRLTDLGIRLVDKKLLKQQNHLELIENKNFGAFNYP